MPQISVWQMIILLFLSRTFNTVTFVPGFSGYTNTPAEYWGILLSGLLAVLLVIPVFLLCRKMPQMNVVAAAYYVSRPIGISVSLLYTGMMLLVTVNTIAHFVFFLTNTIYTQTSVWWLVVPTLLVALYAAFHGIQAIARSGSIVFVVFLLLFGLIVLSVGGDIELVNFRVTLHGEWRQVLFASWREAASNLELAAFALLLPYVKNRRKTGAGVYIVSSTAFVVVVMFLITTVLGDYARSCVFPFYTVASLGEVSVLQRLDSVHIALWTLIGVLKIALFLFLAADCLKYLLPRRSVRWSACICAVCVLPFAIWMSYDLVTLYRGAQVEQSGIPLLVGCVALPLIVLLFCKRIGNRTGVAQS